MTIRRADAERLAEIGGRILSTRWHSRRKIARHRSRIVPESLSGRQEDGLHGKVRSARRAESEKRAVLDQILRAAHNITVGQTPPASETGASASRAGGMAQLFTHPLSQATLWFAVIFALLALLLVGMRRWRGGASDAQLTPSELLTKFRELHGRGGLSDDEYRTIRTKLASQVEGKLNGTNEKS
jgi:uncharacterized membrane protein